MEFKGTKRAKEFAHQHHGPTRSTEKATSETDFLYGYKQALKDCKAPEMLEMLNILVGNIRQSPVDWTKQEKILMAEKLIGEITEIWKQTN